MINDTLKTDGWQMINGQTNGSMDDIPTSLVGTVFLEGVVFWVGLLVLF